MTHPDTSPTQEVRETVDEIVRGIVQLLAIGGYALIAVLVLLWTVYQGVL